MKILFKFCITFELMETEISQRHKYSGAGCVEKSEKHKTAMLAVDDPENIHTCAIRKYLHEIEQKCKCSMRRAYNPNPGRNFLSFHSFHLHYLHIIFCKVNFLLKNDKKVRILFKD